MYRIWYGCLVTLVGKVSNRCEQSGILCVLDVFEELLVIWLWW